MSVCPNPHHLIIGGIILGAVVTLLSAAIVIWVYLRKERWPQN